MDNIANERSSMRTLSETSMCEMEGCEIKATDIVWDQIESKIMLCCEPHTINVLLYKMPEYWHTCENCNCKSPIN